MLRLLWCYQIILLCLLLFLKEGTGNLRFCYKGPHHIKDQDCPGGFYAKKPINVSCAHYAVGEGIPDGSMAQLVENYCSSTKPIDLPLEGGSIPVQWIQEFGIALGDPAGNIVPAGNFSPDSVCAKECLKDWEDPGVVYPEDHLEDVPDNVEALFPPGGNVTLAEANFQLTKDLFMYLLNDDNFEEDDVPGEPAAMTYDPLWIKGSNTTETRLSQLLAQSMRILWNSCNPYVEDSFLRQVLKGFLYLTKRGTKVLPEIGPKEFQTISDILKKCEESPNIYFRLKGSGCQGELVVDSVELLQSGMTWKARDTARCFVWGKYDPLVEAAWEAVSFVHGYCFPHFLKAKNLNHLHMYEVAMEALFEEKLILGLWASPANLSRAIWNSVLETGDIRATMRNIDACLVGGYSASPFRHRLARIFTPEELLENPKYTQAPRNKGWTKSLDQYWAQYEAGGGFKKVANEWGYCLQEVLESELRENLVEELRTKLCG